MGEERNRSESKPELPWRQSGPVVRIETPEQVEIVLPIAPFGSRILAALIDYTILLVADIVLLIATAVVAGLWRAHPSGPGPGYVFAAFCVISFLLGTFYFVWFELRRDGRTPGKRIIGIRVIMDTGQAVTLGASMVRNVARLIDNIPLFWIVPALDKAERRLGDFAAQTLVVMQGGRPKGPLRLSIGDSYAALAEKQFLLSPHLYSKLSPEDLDLIEFFFTESRKLRSERKREQIALSIAERYVRRLGLDGQAQKISEEPVRFLAELLLFLRDRYARDFS